MGVPAFYRWVSEKYPKIVVNVLEKRPKIVGGTAFPTDLNEPNPNEMEFDNLYVDMNGLIHPCSHPEDREAPSTEDEMYLNVTKYLDRLVAAIRPRHVLFLAIDGVAPRAKMNQQRSRRFRSAQEAREKREMMDQIIQDMAREGLATPEKHSSHEWDSNVITPGTEFMTRISLFLRSYILDRMNHDKYWQNLTVVLSDASEPGEGEHKIMNFIRSQRNQPGYNPNTHHVLHGLDADLIMLALATHEARFTILREKVYFGKRGQDSGDDVSPAQRLLDAQATVDGRLMVCADPLDEWVFAKPLQALHVHTLRQYLDVEFAVLKRTLPFPFELERVIDDFIFMCFFVGNDFLPHLPSLDIRDGALDFLMEVYKDALPTLGDYICSPGGRLNLLQADVLLSRVGEVEDQIFLRRKRAEDNAERRMQSRKAQQRPQAPPAQQAQVAAPAVQPEAPKQVNHSSADNQAAARALKEKLLGKRKRSDEEPEEALTAETPNSSGSAEGGKSWDSEEEEEIEEIVEAELAAPVSTQSATTAKPMTARELEKVKDELKKRVKEREQAVIDGYKVTIEDGVKLHEQGWKARYYNDKHKKENIEAGGGLRRLCESYVQGLCWVLQYYYEGVPSWNWFYPFHYAPFASDLVNIDRMGPFNFTLSRPFSPLEQLLAVFPASSAAALPEEVRWLMLDPASPIIDIYNEDVPLDPNGKHLPWLWILLLPFLDSSRITAAFDLCRPQLTLDIRRRNAFGPTVVFVHRRLQLGQLASSARPELLAVAPETDADVQAALAALREEMEDDPPVAPADSAVAVVPVSCAEADGVSGNMSCAPLKFHAPLDQPIQPIPGTERHFRQVLNNNVVCLTFAFPEAGLHRSVMLPGSGPPALHNLSTYDMTPRRPPRLNRSGFNVLELFETVRNQHSGGHRGSSFQAQQHQQHRSHHHHHQQQQQYGQEYQHHSGGRDGSYGHHQSDDRRGDRQGDRYNDRQDRHGGRRDSRDRDRRDSRDRDRRDSRDRQHRDSRGGRDSHHHHNQHQQHHQQQEAEPEVSAAAEAHFVPQITRLGGGFGQRPMSYSSSQQRRDAPGRDPLSARPGPAAAQQTNAVDSFRQLQTKKHNMMFHSAAVPAPVSSGSSGGGFRFSHPSSGGQNSHQQQYQHQLHQLQYAQPSHYMPQMQQMQQFPPAQQHQQPGTFFTPYQQLPSAQAGGAATLQQMREQMLQTLQRRGGPPQPPH